MGIGHKVATREQAISKFAEYWYSERGRRLRQQAMLEIPLDAVLGCYCAPLLCHGDIIAGYLNWKRSKYFEGPKGRTVVNGE